MALHAAQACAAAPKGLRFVHLSDTHCAHAKANPRPRRAFDPHRKDLVNSFRILEAAVKQINESIQPDFVIITGDLVDRPGDLRSLRRVKAILDKLKCRYHPVIGNHDSRRDWRAVFGAGRLNYTFAHGGWRFIAMDSSPNRVEKSALGWLRARLAEDTTTPTAILLHHPLVMPEVYRAAFGRFYRADLTLGNAADVLAVLKKHANVKATFAGHCHLGYDCEWGGLSHHVAPSLVEPGSFFHVVEVRGTTLRRTTRSVRR